MALRVRSFALSDVGIARDNNEDAFLVDEVSGLYLVADGMGGHASGEVASRLCCENVFRVMRTARHSPDFQFPFEIEERRSFEENALANAIKVANQKIFEASAEVAEYRGMGTTVVSVLEDPDRMIVAHVGDSRCYRLRDGKISQVTRDHSLLNHYIHERGMTYEEASKLTESNVILRAVGLKEYIEVDLSVHPKVAGDLYVLCSDGLNDQVPDDVIEQVLTSSKGDMQAAAERLIQLANGHGGLDNCTVVMIEVIAPTEENKAAGGRGGAKPTGLGDAPPPPATTARRGAAPRLSAAARIAAATRGERSRDETSDPDAPVAVAAAAAAAAAGAPGAPAPAAGSGLPSVIIDFDSETGDSNETQPMSRHHIREAIEQAKAEAAKLAGQGAAGDGGAGAAGAGGVAGGAAARGAPAGPAFMPADSYDVTATNALPLVKGGPARRTPAHGSAAAPVPTSEPETGPMPALGAAPAPAATRAPTPSPAPPAPAPAPAGPRPRTLRAAVALQAAGVAIDGRPQPNSRALPEPARHRSGSTETAPKASTEAETSRLKMLPGAAAPEAPQTGGAASPEDASKKGRLPAIGIDRAGFIEGDADTPPGGVSVSAPRGGPGEDVH